VARFCFTARRSEFEKEKQPVFIGQQLFGEPESRPAHTGRSRFV
jgi:hypothetical protein